MSFLDDLTPPVNLQEPEFGFLVENLFTPFDGVRKDTLGNFKNITSKKLYIIESFINKFKTHIGNDIYPSSRLIFPRKDGRKYYIKDVVFAKLVIKIFNIPKNTEDYTLLFNWKRNYHTFKYMGNDPKQLRSLPLVIARIVSNRRMLEEQDVVKQRVTVSDINDALDRLLDRNKNEEQVEILREVFMKLNVQEIRWFCTIILRISILNFFEQSFFQRWHPDGVKLFEICNDLKKTFYYLSDPNKRLTPDQTLVQPMLPFLPQLSHKLTISYDNLCTKMKTYFEMNKDLKKDYDSYNLKGKFLVEEKMDGDRMVLHMKDNRFKFFSRRLKDYTLLYGENYHVGSLTSHLQGAFKEGVNTIILDGEMVAWDFKRNVILPFGTLKSSAIQEATRQFDTTDFYKEQSSYPLFIIFDILHLNGKNLTNLPLYYRKNILRKVINPVPHRLEILDWHLCATSEDIKTSIKAIVSQRTEGIMVKHLQLKYHINNRSHNWIKIKPEYLEQFGENLDLVVIGKEPGIKNSFMVSLKDANNVFNSFCIVANGFTTTEFDKIERLTHNKWVSFKDHPPPSNLRFGAKKPTYWIDPKDSIVLEIKARSIDSTVDSSYAVGSSLHNLFCRRIREDKDPDDCITLEAYKELKLRTHLSLQKSQSVNKKRRIDHDSFLEGYAKRDTSVTIESNLFLSYNFLIQSDYITPEGDRITIKDLKAVIKIFGGEIIQTAFNLTDDRQVIVLSEKLLPSTELYFLKGYNVIKPFWVFECIRRNELLELEPVFIFKSHDSSIYGDKVDKFGDSWVIHCTNIDNLYFTRHLSALEIKSRKEEFKRDLNYLGISNTYLYLFDGIPFYIVNQDNSHNQLLEQRIERFGGRICDHLNECSYVVVPQVLLDDEKARSWLTEEINRISRTISENMEFDSTNTLANKIPNIVTEKFIHDSIKFQELVDAMDYKFV